MNRLEKRAKRVILLKMSMLDELFVFPIIMIDGDHDERQREMMSLMSKDPSEYQSELIRGEAECPYYDFLGISDHWLPTENSLDKALDSKFEACYVRFSNCGSYLVPLNKAEFKKRYKKFVDSLPVDKSKMLVKSITLDSAMLEAMDEIRRANGDEKE